MIIEQKIGIQDRIILKCFYSIFIIVLIFSCRVKAPIVVKEKEYILFTDYCRLDDFVFSANDLVNPYAISLDNISFDKNDSIVKEFKLNKNIIYSPDNKFFILFSFVPSRNFSFSGTCDATIYNKDKALISIIRNVLHNEKVLWFKDYVIFEGNENGFSRKIILDLNSGFSKEVGVLGFFGLIGKSTTSAFYKSYKDGAILGTTRLNSKYSVVSLSINQSNQVYTGNDNKIPYFYTDSVSIIYIPKIDSFKLFMKSNLKLSFNSNVTSIPFDKSNFDSTLYLLINTFKIYKINSNFRLLSNIRPSNKKMDGIMEFQVIGNKVLFKTLKDITEQDLSSTGDYITKNNLKFNIKDTELAISKKFGCCVSEFGIFDIKSQKIYYPTIHY